MTLLRRLRRTLARWITWSTAPACPRCRQRLDECTCDQPWHHIP